MYGKNVKSLWWQSSCSRGCWFCWSRCTDEHIESIYSVTSITGTLLGNKLPIIQFQEKRKGHLKLFVVVSHSLSHKDGFVRMTISVCVGRIFILLQWTTARVIASNLNRMDASNWMSSLFTVQWPQNQCHWRSMNSYRHCPNINCEPPSRKKKKTNGHVANAGER